jgi:hypothetical protein
VADVAFVCGKGGAVDKHWEQTFRERMLLFKGQRQAQAGDAAISIKIRVASGCFHREHSPRAYALIDSYLRSLSPAVEFVEHESGPELLVYIASATALATSVIGLITAIINARAVGVKKGDHPSDPLELIIRRVDDGDEFREEFVLRIGHTEPVDEKAIEVQVEKAILNLMKK